MKKFYKVPNLKIVDLQLEGSLLETSQIPVNPNKPVEPSSNHKNIWGEEGIWK